MVSATERATSSCMAYSRSYKLEAHYEVRKHTFDGTDWTDAYSCIHYNSTRFETQSRRILGVLQLYFCVIPGIRKTSPLEE